MKSTIHSVTPAHHYSLRSNYRFSFKFPLAIWKPVSGYQSLFLILKRIASYCCFCIPILKMNLFPLNNLEYNLFKCLLRSHEILFSKSDAAILRTCLSRRGNFTNVSPFTELGTGAVQLWSSGPSMKTHCYIKSSVKQRFKRCLCHGTHLFQESSPNAASNEFLFVNIRKSLLINFMCLFRRSK